MVKIQKLSQNSARLLYSSNAVTSVYCVVKELIENSLDGGATNIEVRLTNSGLDKIEVRDNGFGIDENDIEHIAKPHSTSKITSHLDLEKLVTYGFRGEALAAICALSSMTVSTKTEKDNFGKVYSFSKAGDITSSKPTSLQRGTTVISTGIFNDVPVRRKYYASEKNKKEEIKKIIDLLCLFACAQIGTRFALHHNQSLIWQKNAVSDLKSSIVQVFGCVSVLNLEEHRIASDDGSIEIVVFLPKIGSPVANVTQKGPENFILIINKRPVKIKAIEKTIQDSYIRALNIDNVKKLYPICVVDIKLPASTIDVNIDPKKMEILLKDMDHLLNLLTKLLQTAFCLKDLEVVQSTKNCRELIINDSFETSKSFANSEMCNQNPKNSAIYETREKPIQNHITSPPNISKPMMNIQNNKVVQREERFIRETQISQKPGMIFAGDRIIETQQKESGRIQKSVQQTHIASNLDRDYVSPIKIVRNSTPEFTNEDIFNRDGIRVQSNSNSLLREPREMLHIENKQQSELTNFFPNNSTLTRFDVKNSSNSKQRTDLNIPTETELISKWTCGRIENQTGKPLQPVNVMNSSPVKRALNNNSIQIEPVKKKIKPAPKNHTLFSNAPRSFSHPYKTAFFLFVEEKRQTVSDENPEYTTKDIARVLLEQWRSSSPEEQKVYQEMSIKLSPKLGKLTAKSQNNISFAVTPKQNIMKPKLTKKVDKKISLFFELENFKEQYKKLTINDVENVEENSTLKPINTLSNGVWICKFGHDVVLANSYRMLEVLLYQRLISSFKLKTDMLALPLKLTPEALGDIEAWEMLIELCHNENASYITNECVTSNGFNIRVMKGPQNFFAEIVAMSKAVPSYGIQDLCEILQVLKEQTVKVSLANCRTKKLLHYLQSEAVRMARQSLPMQRKQEFFDLSNQCAKYFKLDYAKTCFHNKFLLHKLHTITDEN